MKRKDYKTPEVRVVNLNMSHTLLTTSTQSLSGAEHQSTGNFGARGNNSFWDDDEE